MSGDVDRRGRATWIVLILVVAVTYGVVVAVGGRAWRPLAVPAIAEVRFADADALTAGAHCARLGHDPLIDNPCDFAGRAANYPRVWLSIARWAGSTDVLAGAFIALFLLAGWLLFGSLRPELGAIAAFLLCMLGPPTLLAVERGSTELALAGLAGVGLLAIAQPRAGRFAFGAALLAACALLKVFPAAALLVVLLVAVADRRPPANVRRRRIVIASATCALVGALLALQRDDLALMSSAVPRPDVYAYGLGSLSAYLRRVPIGEVLGQGVLYLVVVVVVAVAAIVPGAFHRHASRRGGDRPRSAWRSVRQRAEHAAEHRDAILLAGSLSVYAATAAFANYPYRLLSLVPAVAGAAAVRQRPTPSDGGGPMAAFLAAIAVQFVVPTMQLGTTGLPLSLSVFALGVAAVVTLAAGGCVVWRLGGAPPTGEP